MHQLLTQWVYITNNKTTGINRIKLKYTLDTRRLELNSNKVIIIMAL